MTKHALLTYLHTQFPATVGHAPLAKMLDELVVDADAELFAAAESAADWLCDAHSHSDPWERGRRLRKALKATRGTKLKSQRPNVIVSRAPITEEAYQALRKATLAELAKHHILVDELTCDLCSFRHTCELAADGYNTNGDCLALK